MKSPMINIGASKDTVIEARKAILEILNSSVDQPTMVTALDTLRVLCQVTNTNISQCQFTSGEA